MTITFTASYRVVSAEAAQRAQEREYRLPTSSQVQPLTPAQSSAQSATCPPQNPARWPSPPPTRGTTASRSSCMKSMPTRLRLMVSRVAHARGRVRGGRRRDCLDDGEACRGVVHLRDGPGAAAATQAEAGAARRPLPTHPHTPPAHLEACSHATVHLATPQFQALIGAADELFVGGKAGLQIEYYDKF